MELSKAQRFVKRFVKESTFADIERATREWTVRCNKCSYETDVWEMGGVRWKAAGNKRFRGTCRSCGEQSWLVVERKS